MSRGGSSTQEVRLPEAIERASGENLALADEIGRIGFIPYQGPTVAGLSDMQQASMANTNAAAQAFGLASAPPPMSYQQQTAQQPQTQQPQQPPPGPAGSQEATQPMPADNPALSFLTGQGGKGGVGGPGEAAPQPQQGGASSQPIDVPPIQALPGGMGYGYSPYALYQQSMQAIPAGQRGAIESYMINPQTGGLPSRPLPDVKVHPRSRGKK